MLFIYQIYHPLLDFPQVLFQVLGIRYIIIQPIGKFAPRRYIYSGLKKWNCLDETKEIFFSVKKKKSNKEQSNNRANWVLLNISICNYIKFQKLSPPFYFN